MAEKEIKLGVIGVRNNGKGHIRRSLEVADANVIAVADTNPEMLKSVSDEFGIPYLHEDAEALLARDDIDGVTFTLLGRNDTMTWAQSLEANYTDAIVVLHKGRIVYERYLGVMQPHQPHMAMSVTKSIFGTLGAMLVAEGRLDENALVTKYVPELADFRNLTTGEWRLSITEAPSLALKIGASNEYDSNPDPGDKANDLRYYLSLGLDF